MTKIEIFKRNNRKHYYRIIADTGHNIMSSDSYLSRRRCLNAVEYLRHNIMDKKNIRINELEKGEWNFTVLGPNTSIVGHSMSFHSQSQCGKWIQLMQEHIPQAQIFEMVK